MNLLIFGVIGSFNCQVHSLDFGDTLTTQTSTFAPYFKNKLMKSCFDKCEASNPNPITPQYLYGKLYNCFGRCGKLYGDRCVDMDEGMHFQCLDRCNDKNDVQIICAMRCYFQCHRL